MTALDRHGVQRAPGRGVAGLRRDVARWVPLAVRRQVWYRRHFGRFPALLHPETFNEKVNWRILHDRRDLLRVTCDKLAAKDHALRATAGAVRVPRTFWSGTDVTELAAVDLPEHWVLKPNNGTAVVHFGHGRPDVEALAEVTRGWLDDPLWRRTGEWAYRWARPVLLVEEVVGTPGEPPPDFKVFVFDGVPRLVQVHTDRFTTHRSVLYSADWQPMPWLEQHPPGPQVPRPAQLGPLLDAAASIAAGFDMLRVDFYVEAEEVWFGEMTPYPGSGLAPYSAEMDRGLGELWPLPRLAAVRRRTPRLPAPSPS